MAVLPVGCNRWQPATSPAARGAMPAVAAAPPAAGSQPAGRPGSDWPRFLGPHGNGTSQETGIRTDWKNGLPLVWQCDLGEGYCAPTIASGRLYTFDRHGRQVRLTARDRLTGAEQWRFEYATDYTDQYGYDGGPRCCPVVDGEHVYIYGPEGMLHCLTAADGKPVWKVDTHTVYGVVQNFFGVSSAPVVEGENLIVAVGGTPPGGRDVDLRERDPPSNGTAIVAFDKRTGAEKYRLSNELASFTSPVLATIDGRRWGFYFARGGLVGFDPVAGKLDFHFPWRDRSRESANASSPLVVGDRVLITECYGAGAALLKVRPGGHDVVWSDDPDPRTKRLECHWNTPIHVDGYVYGSSGRHANQAELRCVELAAGKVMWREPGLSRASLTLVDGHFLVLTEYGELLLVRPNPKRYEEVARINYGLMRDQMGRITGHGQLKYPCWASPVVAHGLLYVRGAGRLLCLELIPPQ